MTNLLKKYFKNDILRLILAIFLIELLSLISFKFAWLSGIFFILVILTFILFTLYKLEYGLYIALIELFIGSYGYLFYLQLPGFKMPIRLGIFLALVIIWLIKYIIRPCIIQRSCPLKWGINHFKKDRLVQIFFLLLVFIGTGIVRGYIHGNSLTNIFFDVNGYLYFGLFFIFLDVFQSKRQLQTLLKIFFASIIYLTLKVFATLYIFTHGFAWLTRLFYVWIRDTRVGEITWAGNGFFRIFLQSQIFSLIGIFIIAVLMGKDLLTQKLRTQWNLLAILIIIQTSVLISFSRSFWLGGFIGAIILAGYLIVLYKKHVKQLFKTFGIFLLGGVLSLILMVGIVNFPIPKPSANFSADLLKGRLNAGDAAASSRWNLLPVLIEKVKEHPILGTGFGTTVTYKTEDPRIKNDENPEGIYTTFTFEWGYLDTIIELGAIGFLIYLILIGQILYTGWKRRKDVVCAGLLIGLVVLMVTHAFSPYLNHPLGIGYLMLCASIFRVDL